MKRLFFLLFLCGNAALLQAQQQVKLDTHVSVTFPGTAQEQKSEQGSMWYGAVGGTDVSRAMAMTMSIQLSSMGQDSAVIAQHYDDPAFTQGLIKGMLGKLPGVDLVSQKKITKQARKGYILELKKDKPDDQFPYQKLYTLIVFAGENMYLQAIYAAEGVDATTARDTFFDSFRIK
jgi:hypothetical protein